jgi:hypothetical protein
MNSTTTPTDIQYLIGQEFSAEYIHQEQERELRDALAEDYEGYTDWSLDLSDTFIEGDVDNFAIVNGSLQYKGLHTQRGPYVNGIEV